MLKVRERGTRLPAVMALTVACLTTALGAPRAARAEDGRAASGGSSEAPSTQSAFPQPEVRQSSSGLLKTTLRASIATNKVVDQPSRKVRTIHTPTFEGTIPGPTLSVKPGDKL